MQLHKSQTWLWWSIAVFASACPGAYLAWKYGGPYMHYAFAALAYGAVSSIALYGFDHVHGTYIVFERRFEDDQFVTATVSPTFLLVMGQWAACRSILVVGFVVLSAAYFAAVRQTRNEQGPKAI